MGQRLVPIFDVYGTLLRPLTNEDPQATRLAEILGREDQFDLVSAALNRRKGQAEVGNITAKTWLEGVLYELNDNDTGWRYVFDELVEAMALSHEFPPAARILLDDALAAGQAGLLSNVSPVGRRAAMKCFGLSREHRPGLVVVYSDVSNCRKPDPGCYHIVTDNLSRAPHECLYIDDSLDCVIGAMASGMQGVLLLHDYGATAAQLRKQGQLEYIQAIVNARGGRASLPVEDLGIELPLLMGFPSNLSVMLATSLSAAMRT